MTGYSEVYGDLITLALARKFDVIAHGCNCFCTMGAGVAVPMKNAWKCDTYPLENPKHKGDMNKLGQIDYEYFTYTGPNHPTDNGWRKSNPNDLHTNQVNLIVVNAYTQYMYGPNHKDGAPKPFDYDAFTLCMRKMNHAFTGMHIGMPQIGSHLAGGDWVEIKKIILKELKDCKVTIVIFKPVLA